MQPTLDRWVGKLTSSRLAVHEEPLCQGPYRCATTRADYDQGPIAINGRCLNRPCSRMHETPLWVALLASAHRHMRCTTPARLRRF